MKKEVYPAIDIAKFVMAILVVAIHVRPFGGTVGFIYNDVIARIADPLFFALTSFFLFRGAFSEEGTLKWSALGRYMRRIGVLYGSWVLVYSPVIVKRALYVTGGGWDFVGYLLKSVFLSGPYGALWFLTALLLAIPLTFVIAKCVRPFAALVLSAPFFLFLVAELGYGRVAQHSAVLEAGRILTQEIFVWLWNGLTFGFFFCAMGMWAAYRMNCPPNSMSAKKEELDGKNGLGDKAVLIGVAICLAGLFAEAFLIRTLELGTDYAATFFMIPLTWFLLRQLCRPASAGRKRRGYVFLRKSSILIFTIHFGVMELLQKVLKDMVWYMENTTLQYAAVLAVTLALAGSVYYASRYVKWLGWLKVLY